MKKALISLDAILAIVIITMLVVLIQDYAATATKTHDEYGVRLQQKALGVEMGSQINTFYATQPAAGDYLQLDTPQAKNFSGTEDLDLETVLADYPATAALSVGSDGKVTST